MKWTIEEIEKRMAAGTIQGYVDKKPAGKKKRKKAKYRNQKVEWDGLVFDSKKEYQRYRELLLLLKAGVIGQLERQVTYRIVVDGQEVCRYIADHVYVDAATGATIVEDVKSDATRVLPAYRLKKKLMLAVHNVDIKEV